MNVSGNITQVYSGAEFELDIKIKQVLLHRRPLLSSSAPQNLSPETHKAQPKPNLTQASQGIQIQCREGKDQMKIS